MNQIEKALELFNKKEWEKAIDAFSSILENETEDASLYNSLALCYYNKNDSEQAEKFFLKALEINPKLAEIYINLSDLYLEKEIFQCNKFINKRNCANP